MTNKRTITIERVDNEIKIVCDDEYTAVRIKSLLTLFQQSGIVKYASEDFRQSGDYGTNDLAIELKELFQLS